MAAACPAHQPSEHRDSPRRRGDRHVRRLGYLRIRIIRSTQLIDSTGHVVDISRADPNGIYVGIYDGWIRNHSRWGVAETWRDPLGRSGGTTWRAIPKAATLASSRWLQVRWCSTPPSTLRLIRRATDRRGKAGTGKSTFSGDDRAVQGANSELPAGGALIFRPSADVRITADESAVLPDGTYGNWIGGGLTGSDSTGYVYTRPTVSTTFRCLRTGSTESR